MASQKALESAIKVVAPNATFDLEVVNGHLSGMVVAEEFGDMSHLDRQRKVWEQIRADLGPDAADVGLLLLYSPDEANAVLDDPEID